MKLRVAVLVVGGMLSAAGTACAVSWDDSEAFVVSQLCGGSCSTAHLPEQWRMQRGDLLWRGWSNDAMAAVVP